MKRYKLIGTQENWPSFTPGTIYDADYISDDKFSTCTVQRHAEFTPSNWELVEEFTLPENWSIIRTSDNYEEINKWAKTKSTENFNSDSGKVFYLNEVSSTLTKNYESYTEITFDQFKKLSRHRFQLQRQAIQTRNAVFPGVLACGESATLPANLDGADSVKRGFCLVSNCHFVFLCAVS